MQYILEERIGDPELEEKLLTLDYGGLIQSTTSSFHYQGIPDDILDLIFRDRYQYEIYREKFDLASELKQRVKNLEKNNRSLKAQVNELKGRMLELVIWRELNTYRKKGKPFSDLDNRFRPIPQNLSQHPNLSKIKEMKIGMIYLNYFIQSPETSVLELDLLVEGITDDSYHAIVFEIKNRNEKNCPSEHEIQLFAKKIDVLKYSLNRQGYKQFSILPLYLSANGFDEDSEKWLHKQEIFTSDADSWGIHIDC
ncbi:hypothetical protein MHK_005340 [Candidatus Magnetomorum sp. HK-1]|nr:hypothetical protein MHK_005340 [Candidatus Magnetomorum sp. HK-1]